MRALTVRQPFALAIACGWKLVENRSQALGRSLVGQRLAIHAGKAMPHKDLLWPVLPVADRPADAAEFVLACQRTAGCVIAVGTLDRIIEHGDGDPLHASRWRTGDRFGLVFRDVVQLAKPVPAKGALGIWTLPEDVERAVRAQLGGAT